MFNSPYALFENAVDRRICDVILEEVRAMKLFPGAIGEGKGNEDKGYRDSLVGFFKEDHWVTGVMYHFAAIANTKNWRMALTAPTPVQYAEYSEGAFYDWHMDMGGEPPNTPTTRKVTAILALSDDHEYEEGNLEIKVGWDNRNESTVSVTGLRSKGSLLVFPSLMPHRVTPVAVGTRRTVVCWLIGPHLR